MHFARGLPTFIVLAFVLSSAFSATAQKVAEKKTIGDWTIYERRDFDSETPPPPKGKADLAFSNALNDRKASLEISCGVYSVEYLIHGDDQFNEAMKAATQEAIEIENRRIYATTDKDGLLEGIFVSGGYYGTSFTTFTEPLAAAGKYTICPVNNDKHPACLTFSLKGFTAALKAICPKR